ncbi:MAG: hypothetical protein M1839_003655 [Geoglossum umbratile]|nr:MAG: hypothetical protein M1839_003655 [Geoglossum umbratile]
MVSDLSPALENKNSTILKHSPSPLDILQALPMHPHLRRASLAWVSAKIMNWSSTGEENDAEEGGIIGTAPGVLAALSTPSLPGSVRSLDDDGMSMQVGLLAVPDSTGQPAAATTRDRTPLRPRTPIGISSTDANRLIVTSVDDGNRASNPVAEVVEPSTPIYAQTTPLSAPSSSGVAARESGGSAINDDDATSTPAAAVAVPSTSTPLNIHNEALNGIQPRRNNTQSPLVG